MADNDSIVYFEKQPTIESLQRLSETIKRVQEETGRSAFDSVTYAAVKIAQSGRSASKIGKRKRDIIDNPEWKQAKGSFAWAKNQQRQGKEIPTEAQAALSQLSDITPFFILFRGQNKYLYKAPSYSKQDPRRVIPDFERGKLGGRGLAKVTWGAMAKDMAMSRGKEKFSSRGSQYRISKYKERYGNSTGSAVARMINSLSYLEDAYPGITQTAITRGNRALSGYLDRRISNIAARANR